MQGQQRDRPGQRNIIELFDAVDIDSPNGIHRFLVLEVAGLHFADLTKLERYYFDDAVYFVQAMRRDGGICSLDRHFSWWYVCSLAGFVCN
jgi:hypothetical protein